MDFALTEEQTMFRNMTREFAKRYIEPVARENDRTQHFPQEIIKEMVPLGLLGPVVPQQYGGLGLDYICQAVIAEEVAHFCQSVAVSVFCAHSVVEQALVDWGSDEQRQNYLPRLCSGEILGCYALDEPDRGADVTSLSTAAVAEGDQWTLNGAKSSVINGGVSKLALVFARTDQGISAFLVDPGTPGFFTEDIHDKAGLRSCNTADLVLKDCRIPKGNSLNDADGVKMALVTSANASLALAASCVGVAQACVDAATSYAQERQAFGQPIASFDMVQEMIADMVVGIQAARLLVYHAGFLKNSGQPFIKEASMARYYASRVAMKVATDAIQVHGAYGYIEDYLVERYFRDVGTATLYEGIPLWHKLTVGRHALGLSQA